MIIILKQYKPEFTVYISIVAGIIIFFMSMEKISGIMDVLKNISIKSSINNKFLLLLLKITGIAILTEFAINICKDSGETAIASKIDFASRILIITISIPIIKSLLETVLNILP